MEDQLVDISLSFKQVTGASFHINLPLLNGVNGKSKWTRLPKIELERVTYFTAVNLRC